MQKSKKKNEIEKAKIKSTKNLYVIIAFIEYRLCYKVSINFVDCIFNGSIYLSLLIYYFVYIYMSLVYSHYIYTFFPLHSSFFHLLHVANWIGCDQTRSIHTYSLVCIGDQIIIFPFNEERIRLLNLFF